MAKRGSASVLIDEILRQTTVLVAQISTSAGLRAPLSKIADRVFFELAREIEAQGVTRKVAADMFGMALRTYQKRVQRLRESQSVRERTLWEAILAFIESTGSTSRAQIDKRFARDPEEQRGAVLLDLLQSGLVYSTGRGEQTIYGPTTDTDRRALRAIAENEALSNLAWLTLYQGGPLSLDELASRLECSRERAEDLAQQLRDAGRLEALGPMGDPLPTPTLEAGRASSERFAPGTLLRTRNLMIEAAEAAGWEAAFLDHFRAVAAALGNKLRLGASRSTPGVGGATYAFNVYPGHPQEGEINTLFARVREQIDALWHAVSAYNQSHPLPERHSKLVFYVGQNMISEDDEREGAQQ
jgi:hypothetical protein